METKPIVLRHLHEAQRKLERADFWQTQRKTDVARDLASAGILYAAQSLGLSERAVDVIRMMIVEAEDSSYDTAVATGEIIVESTAQRLFDHERCR